MPLWIYKQHQNIAQTSVIPAALALTFSYHVFGPMPPFFFEMLHATDLIWSTYCYHLPLAKYRFSSDTKTGDACLCDSEGGETVSHANVCGQLCVCLLAISCVLGHPDIGSCLIQFQSLELREDLTLCLPDTETFHIHGCSLALETKKSRHATGGRSR